MDEDSVFVKRAYTAAAILVVLAMLGALISTAFAHQPMGKLVLNNGTSFLYGKKIGDSSGEIINCCKHMGSDGKIGDCKLVPDAGVKRVAGGVIFSDGEFVRDEDLNVSPDDNFYRVSMMVSRVTARLPRRWGFE